MVHTACCFRRVLDNVSVHTFLSTCCGPVGRRKYQHRVQAVQPPASGTIPGLLRLLHSRLRPSVGAPHCLDTDRPHRNPASAHLLLLQLLLRLPLTLPCHLPTMHLFLLRVPHSYTAKCHVACGGFLLALPRAASPPSPLLLPLGGSFQSAWVPCKGQCSHKQRKQTHPCSSSSSKNNRVTMPACAQCCNTLLGHLQRLSSECRFICTKASGITCHIVKHMHAVRFVRPIKQRGRRVKASTALATTILTSTVSSCSTYSPSSDCGAASGTSWRICLGRGAGGAGGMPVEVALGVLLQGGVSLGPCAASA